MKSLHQFRKTERNYKVIYQKLHGSASEAKAAAEAKAKIGQDLVNAEMKFTGNLLHNLGLAALDKPFTTNKKLNLSVGYTGQKNQQAMNTSLATGFGNDVIGGSVTGNIGFTGTKDVDIFQSGSGVTYGGQIDGYHKPYKTGTAYVNAYAGKGLSKNDTAFQVAAGFEQKFGKARVGLEGGIKNGKTLLRETVDQNGTPILLEELHKTKSTGFARLTANTGEMTPKESSLSFAVNGGIGVEKTPGYTYTPSADNEIALTEPLDIDGVMYQPGMTVYSDAITGNPTKKMNVNGNIGASVMHNPSGTKLSFNVGNLNSKAGAPTSRQVKITTPLFGNNKKQKLKDFLNGDTAVDDLDI